MKEIVPDNLCYGCGICVQSCPRNAITMKTNEEGFLIPIINSALCVNCGICQKVCGSINSQAMKNKVGKAYGAMIVDNSIRRESTSGGVFTALARVILHQNGCVFGAASVDNYIRHIKTESEEELAHLRGSKYVQSDLTYIVKDLINAVDAGRLVLFSGTPCQCSSIKSFLAFKKCDLTNIYFVDVVCHGVCSPIIFQDYICFYNQRNASHILEHRFRVKNNGWSKHTEENVLENGKKDSESYDSQVFKSVFYSHYAIRQSCYRCKFTSVERVSDITLADFWGLEKRKPEHYDPDGVSFVLVNSEQGKKLFTETQNQLSVFDAKIEDTDQPHLYKPCVEPADRKDFWDFYFRKGFYGVAIKYFHAGKVRRFLADNLRKIFIHKC